MERVYDLCAALKTVHLGSDWDCCFLPRRLLGWDKLVSGLVTSAQSQLVTSAVDGVLFIYIRFKLVNVGNVFILGLKINYPIFTGRT